MAGATDVTLEDLLLTGGVVGIDDPDDSGSTGLTVTGCSIYANSTTGILHRRGDDGASSSNDQLYGLPDLSNASAQPDGILIGYGNDTSVRAPSVSGNTSTTARVRRHHAHRDARSRRSAQQPHLWQRHRHQRLSQRIGAGRPVTFPVTSVFRQQLRHHAGGESIVVSRTRSTANPASDRYLHRPRSRPATSYNTVYGSTTASGDFGGSSAQYRLRQLRGRHARSVAEPPSQGNHRLR